MRTDLVLVTSENLYTLSRLSAPEDFIIIIIIIIIVIVILIIINVAMNVVGVIRCTKAHRTYAERMHSKARTAGL
jgi:hypothetical protein